MKNLRTAVVVILILGADLFGTEVPSAECFDEVVAGCVKRLDSRTHKEGREIFETFATSLQKIPVAPVSDSFYLQRDSYLPQHRPHVIRGMVHQRANTVLGALANESTERAVALGETDLSTIEILIRDLPMVLDPYRREKFSRIQALKVGGVFTVLIGGFLCKDVGVVGRGILGTGGVVLYNSCKIWTNPNKVDYAYLERSFKFFRDVEDEVHYFSKYKEPSPRYPKNQILWNYLRSEKGSLDFAFGYTPDGQPAFAGAATGLAPSLPTVESTGLTEDTASAVESTTEEG